MLLEGRKIVKSNLYSDGVFTNKLLAVKLMIYQMYKKMRFHRCTIKSPPQMSFM